MKSQLEKIILVCLAVLILGTIKTAKAASNDPLDKYNVIWNSHSNDSSGSMPIGNGDIGINLWAERDGDLLFYIGKTDAWSDNARLLKLGLVRVKFTPNPFANGLPFEQTLKLRQGEIVIKAGDNIIRAWVDANNPVIHIETEGNGKFDMQVTLETWRNEPTELKMTTTSDAFNNIRDRIDPEEYPQAVEKTGEGGRTTNPYPTIVEPDIIMTDQKDRVVWYHHNIKSAWPIIMNIQSLQGLVDGAIDPLLDRTFGGLIKGKGLKKAEGSTLSSTSAQKDFRFSVYVHTAHPVTPENWLKQLEAKVKDTDRVSIASARKEHRRWWDEFWNRSWIRVSGDKGADTVSKGYTLFRYMLACGGRGEFPIKFNGSIFTYHPGGEDNDADYRRWGPCYWWQNQRLFYWPMIASGDFDIMKPFFKMYLDVFPLSKARTKLYYGHEGINSLETLYFWGATDTDVYGWNRRNMGISDFSSPYVIRYWQSGLELIAMMLGYYTYTQDDSFLKNSVLPVAKEIIKFYDLHYKRDENGKIHLYPAQSLETWHKAENPLPDIAGLKFILQKLLALPDKFANETQRQTWRRILKELPDLPFRQVDGQTILAPAHSYSNKSNIENPELYAVFPYRLYGVGKDDLEMAQLTFKHRLHREGNKGHDQDDAHAAYVGLTEQTRKFIVRRFGSTYLTGRFPTMWNSYDWMPDHCHGGVGMIALQAMLMQCENEKILLLPTWPKDWDVEFKLHAPYNTKVQGIYKDGKLKDLKVTPKSRAKDVVLISDERSKLSKSDLKKQLKSYLPRLTPRPVSVAQVDSTQVSLNGIWNFNPEPPGNFWKADFVPKEKWSDIEVPGEWAMQGFRVEKDTAAGYRRKFIVPSSWKDKRVKLRCDAVYSDATVWINGLNAGHHEGGFTPFELDVTDLITPGNENIIALSVKNESVSDIMANGSGYAYHQLGGITRKIYMFAVPEINIASLHVETTFDKNYRKAVLKVFLDIANESKIDLHNGQVNFQLEGPNGKPIPIDPQTINLSFHPAGKTISYEIDIPVNTPKKWDAEHPHLYNLTCHLLKADVHTESVQKAFGFRQVEVRGNQLFVNNHPVKLRGVNRHEVHPLWGRSLRPELWRKDAEIFRQGNINYIRTSHYPPAEEFLDACDELGLFVEDEAPFCGVGWWGDKLWKTENCHDHKYRNAIIQPVLEMIQRDRSHPCVIIWSIANESSWGSHFHEAVELTRQIDPSRPTIFSAVKLNVDDHICQIASMHYPGYYAKEWESTIVDNDRPILFDEYCHVGRTNRREKITDPGLRDYYGINFANMWEKMYQNQACLGGAIWAAIDDVFFLDGRQLGYGYWGPIDSWRRPKPEYWHIKKIYSPIRIFDKTVNMPDKGQLLQVEVENRYDFTNLSEVRTEWSIDNKTGIVISNIEPRSKGMLSIDSPVHNLEGKKLALKFYHRDGFLIDAYELSIGKNPLATDTGSIPQRKTDKPVIRQNDNYISVKGRDFLWEFDSETGLISKGQLNKNNIVIGGPYLAVTPIYSGSGSLTGGIIKPYNIIGSNWRKNYLNVSKDNHNNVFIILNGSYDQAKGSFIMKIDLQGVLEVDYEFEYLEEINPREIGIAFDVVRACDTLSWDRDAQWTWYPEDHIGRVKGQTPAFRSKNLPEIKPFTQPQWTWYMDSTAGGTNDFRSTKRNIYYASLTDANQQGLYVRSNGQQHVRVYVNGDHIRLHTNDYSNAGDQIFPWFSEGKPLNRGSMVKGIVQIGYTCKL